MSYVLFNRLKHFISCSNKRSTEKSKVHFQSPNSISEPKFHFFWSVFHDNGFPGDLIEWRVHSSNILSNFLVLWVFSLPLHHLVFN